MYIGSVGLAVIAFLVSWLVFKAPVIGVVLAVVILLIGGGIWVGHH